MTWNYRIIRHVDADTRESFRIHEAYYKDEKVVTVSEEPATPSGESRTNLEQDIRLMLEAFEKPILNYSEI
jgi:hypothetical protein